MSKVSAAVQDLMRDTASLLDKASKINTQLLQIDTFINQQDMQALMVGLDQSQRQYKASLEHARACTAELVDPNSDETSEEPNSNNEVESLQHERDQLQQDAVSKSEEMRQLLDCMRQVQLASAQLIQTYSCH
ncbi:hypothetical protein GGH14_004725 [Coemansia sp. RSA 370]|nr:hypothetical protein GGH14_004725 [Coemansia sp. RSA 370]KAJ2546796.1 hypothetical protein IWW35_004881 [Coemansia sp. RSA 1878]